MHYQPNEAFARQLDAEDPLRSYREQFHVPRSADGAPLIYFCGHSLGLQPKGARPLLEQELEDWAMLGVEGHFHARSPWYSYHELFRETGARLVGARPGEVVMMNSLTVNLHLMLTTFYRPTPQRYRILTDAPSFPSDRYALLSQIRLHGFDPADALRTIGPRPGEDVIRLEDVETILEQEGPQIAVVLWNGVNFCTGQSFNLARLAAAAHRQGCIFGCDLAHAAGNIPLELHAWHVDFAVWCGYKYLNAGPGAVAGCFVHDQHGHHLELPRLAGWWGNDPATRFQMHQHEDFIPRPGADGWQLSNPPILALAPLRASLALFDAATLPALRAKSERLTGYLEYLLDRLPVGRCHILTPRDPAQRGCQLSLRLADGAQVMAWLAARGVVCDLRPPDVLRVAPVPLYNTYTEVWRFARLLGEYLEQSAT
ncbi:MAG: kynureninase [Gemmataceae bacterium]